MIYKFKLGARLSADAQSVGERLAFLSEKNNGELTPEIVLKDAKSKSSPLHDAFEWDDTKAAYQYRLSQARYVLRMIEVVQDEKHDGTSRTVRAHINVESSERKVYRTVQQVMQDEHMRGEFLGKAKKELLDWKNRYENFKEFAEVFVAIDNVVLEDELAAV